MFFIIELPLLSTISRFVMDSISYIDLVSEMNNLLQHPQNIADALGKNKKKLVFILTFSCDLFSVYIFYK